MKRREAVFAGGDVVKTRFTGLTPFACLPLLDSDLPEAVASLDTDFTALVSFVENGDARYLVMVNSSWKKKCKAVFTLTQPCVISDRAGCVSECPEGKKALVIDEGDMLVIKY